MAARRARPRKQAAGAQGWTIAELAQRMGQPARLVRQAAEMVVGEAVEAPEVWTYTRADVARAVGLTEADVLAAEQRGELDPWDLASVVAFGVSRRGAAGQVRKPGEAAPVGVDAPTGAPRRRGQR